MAYYFFFGVVPLPITPSSLNISTPSKNTTVTLINEGEINIPKTEGLRDISFEFMLPQVKYPFANYSLSSYTATTMIPLLNELKSSKKPFQFIVTRMNPKGKVLFFTNIKVVIEDFSYNEDAEANGMDVMCDIKLKEYRPYSTASIKVSTLTQIAGAVAVTAVSERDTSSKVIPKTITVKSGDTLWTLCKKHLGDGSKYKEIAKLNKLENPDSIQVGQKLRLS